MSKRKRISTEVVSGIYCIKNIINDKVYIGSSKDIYKRWIQHKNSLSLNKHHCIHLQNAWNLYGEDKFEFKILEVCSEDSLFNKEQDWYDYFKCWDDKFGYNCSETARSPSFKATVESLKNGEHTITYKQFNDILDLLSNTEISIPKIANITKAPERTIYQIYFKAEYGHLTENHSFIKRTNKGQAVLSKEEVIEIIDRLKKNEFNSDIAKDYGVSSNTIDDIRNHRTWKELTNGITFDSIKGRNRAVGAKPICQYDETGKLLKTFASAREAERETGIGYKLISQVCNGEKRIAHGYIWRFCEDAFDKYETENTYLIKVDQYSKTGEFLKTYNSIKEASEAVGKDISSALRGRTKSCGGYYWSRYGEIPLPLQNLDMIS